jgi:hypothetical protein
MLGIMKYIIVDDRFPVVFPAQIYHVDAFRLVCCEMQGRHVTGAGYIGAAEDGKLYVYGRSEGFNIDAKPEDLEKIMGALHRPCKPM